MEWLQNKCSKANTNDLNFIIASIILEEPITLVSRINEAIVSQFLGYKIFSPTRKIISLLYEEDLTLQILPEQPLELTSSEESGIRNTNPFYIVKADSNIYINKKKKPNIIVDIENPFDDNFNKILTQSVHQLSSF